jgi:hypothetical protein
MALLKRKRIVDDALARRMDIGTNVALVLARVETAQADHMALAALQQGASALKVVRVEPEDVDRLLEEFSDLAAVQDEVSEVLAASANGDMEDLEKELAALTVEPDPLPQQQQQPAVAVAAAAAIAQPQQPKQSVQKKLELAE